MPGELNTTDIRFIRLPNQEDESSLSSSSKDAETTVTDLEAGGSDIGYRHGGNGGPLGQSALSEIFLDDSDSKYPLLKPLSEQNSSWARRKRIPFFGRWSRCRRRLSATALESSSSSSVCSRRKPRALRALLRSIAIALMILGLVEFIILVTSLITSFFPETYESFGSRPSSPSSHWPTDSTADIQPFQCHSHNDYWRRIPLKSAIKAGCTSVEADVWLFPEQSFDELYVGHSTASLTSSRTFRSLYINPLVELLDRQNPNTTFHPILDSPRNGIFDVDAAQTLVLLIDFKTDGQKLWPVVSQQLEPLRKSGYLTHFNGTAVINGPVTIVVTGNAPFNKVVENPRYRDMFFDAPLELLGGLADGSDKIHSASTIEGLETWKAFDDFEERAYLASYANKVSGAETKGESNQGQGHSGSAPKNAAIYTPANSYYASVSFGKSVGHLIPYPYLTQRQKTKIRHQIAGAHKQGLKVRYWDTPAWPRGLRNYIWQVLVEAGADYLNVDDLRAATRGRWGGPGRRRHKWGLDWNPWDRR